MTDIIDILQYSFVQRALLASLLLACMTGIIGGIMIIRHASFFGDAIAHSSLAGIAVALFAGLHPLATAFFYAAVISVSLPVIRSRISFSFDNVLGIVLPFSMGLGVLIFSQIPGYQPELLSYLFGSIVSVTWTDVYVLATLLVITGVILWRILPTLLFVSLDEEYARILRIRVSLYDILFHVLIALVIVSGVRIVGVILVNALLIIPASIGKLFARSIKELFVISFGASLVCVLGGTAVSLFLNAPTGASIAVFSGLIFFLSAAYHWILGNK